METNAVPYLPGAVINWEMALTTVVIPWTAKLFIAILVALATIFVAGRIKTSVQKSLERARADRSTTLLMGRIAHIGVLAVGVIMEMGIFGINWTVLIAMISVISLAISLAVQDVLKSFVAGLYLLIERPFRIGESIKFKDFTGHVEHVGIRTTVLRTEEGHQVVVPNSTIFVEVITNRGNSQCETASAVADQQEIVLNPRQ